jgi:hypothetical protein
MGGMRLVAERILREAIEKGTFDVPSNKRRSLNLEENPFQDPASRLSFHVLKNAGMRPLWLENEIEIRNSLQEIRTDLIWAAKQCHQKGDGWDDAVNHFIKGIEQVNGLIRKLNLEVPLTRFQRAILTPQDELRKVIADLPDE